MFQLRKIITEMGGESMKIRKNIIATIAILILGLAPAVATVPAYAASTTAPSTHQSFLDGLIQMIAQKFGLDQNQVKSAVTDYANQQKQQRQQHMQDKEKAHLDSLVTKGTITSSQEQQILDEQNKLRSEYNPQDFENLTAQERKQKMQQEQQEIQDWSKSTGIDAKYLRPGFGMRMHMFNRWNNNVAPTQTP